MATVNDLVLVHIDNQPAFFARIEEISPDVKPGWWHVTLLALGIPLQLYTWILDTDQIGGAPFTMGGTPIRLEKVVSPHLPSAGSGPDDDRVPHQEGAPASPPSPDSREERGRIVSLDELRKKR